MKKSLIALAVLAASGATLAQSATVYGIADIWVGQVDNGVSTSTKIDSGGVSTSRWGIKGSEDLGGGLKANFQLEQGVTIDDGAPKNNTPLNGTPIANGFLRQAWVGFSGGFGEVRLGNTGTAFDDVDGATKGAFGSKLSAREATWISGNSYTGSPTNTIYYASPSFGGFSGALSYALGENAVVGGASAGSLTSMNIQYGAGPVYVALGYQTEKATGAVQDKKFTEINASYDLGVAKLLAGYGKATQSGTPDSTDYAFGVDYPVSAALTLSAEYAKSSTDAMAGVETNRSGYGLAAAYSLSKRTTVYGGYRAETAETTGAVDVDTSLLAIGIKHTF